MNSKELSMVIPVHNEEGNLPALLDQLVKRFKEAEIIVVNDHSSDDTERIANTYAKKYSNICVIHRKKGNRGMGASLKEGTRFAKGRYVVWIMGDNSDDLTTIPGMILKLEKGADVVFGSRYMRGGSSGDLDAIKALLSSGYTLATRLVFGVKVHDITNAFRGFRKQAFDQIHLESDDFAISPEFAIKAQRLGFKLDEVPTTYKNRVAGKQKFKMIKMGLAYTKLFKYRFFY